MKTRIIAPLLIMLIVTTACSYNPITASQRGVGAESCLANSICGPDGRPVRIERGLELCYHYLGKDYGRDKWERYDCPVEATTWTSHQH